MKYPMMIKLIAVTGLVVAPLNAMASGFGGGWMQDKTTGTIYYSRAPSPERQQAASDAQPSNQRLNGFGGGWVQDKHTNTLSYHPEHDAS